MIVPDYERVIITTSIKKSDNLYLCRLLTGMSSFAHRYVCLACANRSVVYILAHSGRSVQTVQQRLDDAGSADSVRGRFLAYCEQDWVNQRLIAAFPARCSGQNPVGSQTKRKFAPLTRRHLRFTRLAIRSAYHLLTTSPRWADTRKFILGFD